MTADEPLLMNEDHERYELVRGELRTMPLRGMRCAHLAARIIASVYNYAESRRLGAVGASVGFWIARDPDTVRGVPLAFIRAERVVHSDGYFEGPPDAAFELISPNDPYVDERVADLLSAGTQAFVLVDPRRKTVHIHRPNEVIAVTDAISLDDIIPGWTLLLAKLFAR